MVVAFILANTKTGKESDVINSLKVMPEIKEAHSVYGDYDIYIRAETENLEHLNDFLLKKIRGVTGISCTTTMIGL
ncbi:MAG: Lrp/AsnC ligand binding domain-containing protein [archaeon]